MPPTRSRRRRAATSAATLAIAVTFAAACSSAEEPEVADADITASDCSIANAADGRPLTKADLAKLNDPLARFALAGKGCPRSFGELQAKLKKTDDNACLDDDEGSAGVTTRLVSERSQVLGAPDTYRAVISRTCGNRKEFSLLMSIFGIDAEGRIGGEPMAKATDVEVIGRDQTTGVFNFYLLEKGQWKFAGNSLDALADGYDCNADGACTPRAAKKMRCAGCHVGGGLVMKELTFPWLHWEGGEGGTTTPGAETLLSKHRSLLGSRGFAAELEGTIQAGNRHILSRRIQFLKERGTEELLRPLFCTVDVNLASRTFGMNDGVSDGVTPFSVGGFASTLALTPSSLLDVGLGKNFGEFEAPSAFGERQSSDAQYKELAASFNQRVTDASGKTLTKKGGAAVTDTFFPFTVPVVGDFDRAFVAELIEQKLLDLDFVKDVRHVDFTRPVFSAARCDLLKHAPKLAPSAMNPGAIRDGFKASLASDPTPTAKKLLANLNNAKDLANHDADVTKFFDACGNRPEKDLIADVMIYASHVRRAARNIRASSGQGIIEFSETMAVDDIPDTMKALDPTDCTLK